LNKKYNLIITSIELSDGNGVEFITRIREISKDITIFIISGKDDTEYFIDLIRLGIDGFVLKPIQVKQFVEVFQKVIEKFKYKEEVYKYKLNLEEIVYEKTKNLQELNESLEIKIKNEVLKNIKQEKLLFEQSKLASMGEMIGNIAHQWRQPLSAISTAMSGMVIQKEMDMLNDDNFYSNSNIIIDNTEYLSKIIDDFRDFIKKDKKKIKFNVKKQIEDFISFIQSSSNQNNIELIIDISKDIEIFGYQNEITQSIVTIFNNTKDAFIQKDKDIENKYFFINGYIDNSNFILELKDNAGGIKAEYIEKVFEPYFTTKHKSQGTGLGLYVSYNSIKSMGGSIEVNNTSYQYLNKEYKGAIFRLEIPSGLDNNF
ncbi:MAG: hybrid sensor histidine kinase/response regulator, partial [Campylobacterota bacterium]|nr:hybrid sensor histidine kinase/response regulator [Campylobacterota bacterium]